MTELFVRHWLDVNTDRHYSALCSLVVEDIAYLEEFVYDTFDKHTSEPLTTVHYGGSRIVIEGRIDDIDAKWRKALNEVTVTYESN